MSTVHFAVSIRQLITHLARDERGAVYVSELILTASILALGSIVGLSAYQTAVVTEYSDLGVALSSLNQSYSYQIQTGTTTTTISHNDSTPPVQHATSVVPAIE